MASVHDLTVTREGDWGEVKVHCSVCGYVGKFQSATAAYTRHPRTGPVSAMQACYARGAVH